jgi:phosphate starvation-inducible membrane PsiE
MMLLFLHFQAGGCIIKHFLLQFWLTLFIGVVVGAPAVLFLMLLNHSEGNLTG